MKKPELKQIIREEIEKLNEGESFNADKNNVFRISYFSDSYQISQEVYVGKYKECYKYAEDKLEDIANTSRPKGKYWASISVPDGWEELTGSGDRIKINK